MPSLYDFVINVVFSGKVILLNPCHFREFDVFDTASSAILSCSMNRVHFTVLVRLQCTKVRLASFQSGGFITVIVVDPPESKLAKRTSVELVAKGVASDVNDER